MHHGKGDIDVIQFCMMLMLFLVLGVVVVFDNGGGKIDGVIFFCLC